MSQPAHVIRNIKIKTYRLKLRLGDRVWVCTNCDAVLGVFDQEYTSVDIKSQKVQITISGGSLQRTCQDCKTVNNLSTRHSHETLDEWKQTNRNKLATLPKE